MDTTRPFLRCFRSFASVLAAVGLLAPPGLTQGHPPSREHGAELFARHCAACHGPGGRGDGPAAEYLHPKPRDFGSATFRLVSTRASLPHDDDLRAAIVHGLPGTAMPGYDHLPEQDLTDLVAVVRDMILDNKVRQIMELTGEDRSRAILEAIEVLDTGGQVALGPEPRRSLEGMLRGRELFETSCARCHDLDGRAEDRLDLLDNRGEPIAARNFRRGIFKGGTDSASIVRRILLGMPGGPMPAMQMPEDDAWNVAHYLQSMIDPDAIESNRQGRRTLVALRVRGSLTEHMHTDDWARAPETWVPLMPMTWRRDRPEGLSFRALHDGRHLAMRIRWTDRSDDAGAPEPDAEPLPDDGLAVQLARGIDPPFFGMGGPQDDVTILQWRAGWQRRSPGAWASLPLLVQRLPAGPGDGPYLADGPPRASEPLPADPTEAGPVRDWTSRGPGQLHPPAALADTYRGRGLRTDDGWDVMLLRDLETDDGGPELTPGAVASIAFAVWDGSTGDAGPRKNITIWQHLLLEE